MSGQLSTIDHPSSTDTCPRSRPPPRSARSSFAFWKPSRCLRRRLRSVADELCDANLVGHDSHGIMRIVQYCQMLDEGYFRPGSPFEVQSQFGRDRSGRRTLQLRSGDGHGRLESRLAKGPRERHRHRLDAELQPYRPTRLVHASRGARGIHRHDGRQRPRPGGVAPFGAGSHGGWEPIRSALPLRAATTPSSST